MPRMTWFELVKCNFFPPSTNELFVATTNSLQPLKIWKITTSLQKHQNFGTLNPANMLMLFGRKFKLWIGCANSGSLLRKTILLVFHSGYHLNCWTVLKTSSKLACWVPSTALSNNILVLKANYYGNSAVFKLGSSKISLTTRPPPRRPLTYKTLLQKRIRCSQVVKSHKRPIWKLFKNENVKID